MIRYAHTNIITPNWQKLASFYVDVLGCSPVPPTRDLSGQWLDVGTGLQNACLKGIHLQLPGYQENGPTLEIFEYQEMVEQVPIKPNFRGFGHIAFEVSEITETIAQVIQHGGEKFGELTQNRVKGVGILSFIYVRDPDGNLIELQNWQK